MADSLLTPTFVDVRTPAPEAPAELIAGYAGIVLEVADIERAQRFYAGALGLPEEEASSGEAAFRAGRALITLVQAADPRTLPNSGTHFGLCFAPDQLQAISGRLAEAGVELFRHHEDRQAERAQNRYCLDPDGNRLQLVTGEAPGIDHVAIETHDIEWAETFYTQVLGGIVENRVGWRMADYTSALDWGAGRDDCAPGTRRMDKRYTSIEHKGELPRPNPHIFVTFSPGVTLGIYLATEHRQEPPPDQFLGTPRIIFRAVPGQLAELERRLRDVRLRPMYASPVSGGPFERQGDSLFVRDPAGNFTEIQE